MTPKIGWTQKKGGFLPRGLIATKGDHSREFVPEFSESAKPSIVGFKKRADSGNSRSNCWLISLMRRIASRESPPKSKKLSRIPTGSAFRISDQILARVDSVGVRGAMQLLSIELLVRFPGAGRRMRSILPLGVRGKKSIATKALGIM